MYDEYTAMENDSQKEYAAQAETEQLELEKQFSESNPIQPPELRHSEEEYAEYSENADRVDYEPVDDYEDEPDAEYDDVAPIVGEMLALVGDDE